MDNSISINLEGNNTMDSLTFHWMAEFNDGVLFQFNADGTENRFKEVQDRMKDLEYFHLYSKTHRFIVDLKQGLIKFNDAEVTEEVEKKYNIRLIFFRRHRVTMNESGKENSHKITYHLGFQYLKNVNNRQITLQIDNEGNWVIGE